MNRPIPTREVDSFDQISYWNRILIQAARDLAELTRHGIHANFIAELARKCERLEKERAIPGSANQHHLLEEEIREGIESICSLAQRIWEDQPGKSQKYRSQARELQRVAG